MSLRKVVEKHGLDWCGSEQGKVAATCECGIEPSGFIQCRNFLTS
jgi:hypothetical protein